MASSTLGTSDVTLHGVGRTGDSKVFFDTNVPVFEEETLTTESEQEEDYNHHNDHMRVSTQPKGERIENHIKGLIRTKTKLDLEVAHEVDDAERGNNDDLDAKAEMKTFARKKNSAHTYRVKEGFLKKRSHGLVNTWQKRWFYLINEKLIYFKRGRTKPCGIIPLENCHPCEDVSTDGFNGRFKMRFGKSEKDTFYFDTRRVKTTKDYDEEEEKALWIAAINHNIKVLRATLQETVDSRNAEEVMEDEVRPPPVRRAYCCTARDRSWKIGNRRQKNFSELPTVRWKQYMATAKTGDVLLFNSNGAGPSIIRFGTNSSYDHVGLVVKMKGRRACVLEALGEGVSIEDFANFYDYGWCRNYPCLAVRRLHADLTKSQVAQLEDFVTMVIGRKYNLWKPNAMFRKKSVIIAEDPDRAFFCSELVACAFKQAGLLPTHQASSCYVPGAFAECAGMRLLCGARLGPEERIIFDNRPERKEGKGSASTCRII